MATTFTIDSAHSTADFKVRHLMISNVRGEFSGVTGTVIADLENPSNAKIDVSIDATTIQTREPQRDAHLKSADFFDVEKYPKMTFVSKKITKIGDGEWKVTGDLTIKSVTREVVLNVEGPTPEVRDPWGGVRTGATATTKINRKDFDLTWNLALEAGGFVVGDEVAIHIELELVKQG